MPADRSRPSGFGPSQSQSQWTSICVDDSIESQTPFALPVFPPPPPAIAGPESAGQNPSWHRKPTKGAAPKNFAVPLAILVDWIQALDGAVPRAW